MKRLAILAVFLCAGALASAQVPTTTNLQLSLPPYAAQNWNVYINQNFTTLDTVIGLLQLPYQGAWSSTTVYSRGMQVSYSGGVYASRINSNLNNLPTNATAWQTLPGGGGSSGSINLFVNGTLVAGSLSATTTTINGGSL